MLNSSITYMTSETIRNSLFIVCCLLFVLLCLCFLIQYKKYPLSMSMPSIAFHFHLITFKCVLKPLNGSFYQECQNALTFCKSLKMREKVENPIILLLTFRLECIFDSYAECSLFPTSYKFHLHRPWKIRMAKQFTNWSLRGPISTTLNRYTLYADTEERLIDTIEILFTFHIEIARNSRLPWQCNNNTGAVTIDSLHFSILFHSFIRSTYWTRVPRGLRDQKRIFGI